jgi:hypothetical protein
MQTPLPDELNVLPVYRNVPLKNAVKYENSEWTGYRQRVDKLKTNDESIL